MKIPKYIVIKGEVWSIKVTNLDHIQTYDDKGISVGHAVGLCESSTKTLFFHKGLDSKLLKSTFLHELGHAIFTGVGFNQTSLSSDFEELIVENFANVFCKILKDINLVKPLLVEDKKPKKKKKT